MSALDNKQLLNLIRYAPVVVVFVFALAVNLIAIQDNREQAARSIENLREELTLQRKESIRSQVHQVYNNLLFEKSKTQSDLKDAVKQRVYEAYGIAHYIYARNSDKSKAEVSKLIIEALRSVRFFDGRGYFFILSEDGTTVMNGANAYLEGTNVWDFQDDNGHFIAREMLNISEKNEEGFLHWRFKKPGSAEDKTFDKIGYIKKFEPYNWSIATGEYLSDFEVGVKAKLLKWFSEYEYGENGYFFVLDNAGTVLSHHKNDFLGVDFTIGNKVKQDFFQEVVDQVNQGGGYVRYLKPLTLSGNLTLEQVNYVKELKDWNWIIATGFSTQKFEKNLRKKEAQLFEFNYQSLMRLIYLTIASMLFLTLCSLYVGNLIARRFELFQKRIERDFEELNNTKNRMEYMALHDDLTSLPNRVLMLQDIQKNIELTDMNNEKLAVMFVDLDNFKNVNDLYGHHAGDLLLEVVGQKFKTLVSSFGSVSRFGGDEFVFCFPSLKDTQAAEEQAARIRNVFLNPFIVEGRSLMIGCSIGVSIYPDDSTNVETLISQADTVLYKSKADKKGQVLFYNSSISEQIKRKMEVQYELACAIERNQVSVYYQPQMSAKGKELVSVEALARWKHPLLGDISPDEFIAIAEEAGVIHDLGLFVFKRACEDIYALSANGEEALKLSVNISPVQLMEPEFASRLVAICTEVGIDIRRVTLEVTENIFIHSLDTVSPLLSKLRDQGFGLSLDDFGTGYSSLSYINSLPLTEIKIDRSFIQKFLDYYQSDMLVRMIISIGRLCGLVVVAEGVESKPQLKRLLGYGCDLVQGYYFDRPLTIERLSEKFFNKPDEHVIPLTHFHSNDV